MTTCNLWSLSATEAARRIAEGSLTCEVLVRACLQRIRALEPRVRAWAWLDEDAALEHARQLDGDRSRGALHGVPVGIKDVFDTADMPTQHNSVLRRNHRPGQDAAAVSLLKASGALILGKTTTQEFGAGGTLPDTRNPHDLERTPGASSSGSAAAVAAGMVPLALGTQTGGSLLRPASYCGVYALKPTWNVVSREGAMGSSLSQDTVGWYARSLDDLELLAQELGALRDDGRQPLPRKTLKVGLCPTPMWPHAGAASRTALETVSRWLKEAGAEVTELELPSAFARLGEMSRLIMAAEGRSAFAALHRSHREALHADFRAYLEKPFDIVAVLEALDFSASCRPTFDALAAPFDVVLAPSAAGEAPKLPDKGDSIFQRMWTLLHVPCINVPGFTGGCGLPIGLTALNGRYRDAHLLASVRVLDRLLRERLSK
jgi:Asp-tRNA(Asn)/Glu-tRNA(Gln) amidotransferase A subunit family amidase